MLTKNSDNFDMKSFEGRNELWLNREGEREREGRREREGARRALIEFHVFGLIYGAQLSFLHQFYMFLLYG